MKDLAIWVEEESNSFILAFEDYNANELTFYRKPISQADRIARRVQVWFADRIDYRIRPYRFGFGLVVEKAE